MYTVSCKASWPSLYTAASQNLAALVHPIYPYLCLTINHLLSNTQHSFYCFCFIWYLLLTISTSDPSLPNSAGSKGGRWLIWLHFTTPFVLSYPFLVSVQLPFLGCTQLQLFGPYSDTLLWSILSYHSLVCTPLPFLSLYSATLLCSVLR